MNRGMCLFAAVVGFLAAGVDVRAGDKPLPRSTPEAQGISSEAVLRFVEAADRNVNAMHSFMVVRHGSVIAEGWWKPEAADNAYRGDGAGGQLCLVLPEQDAVIAITAATGNFNGEMNAVWDNLLPAFKDGKLPEDAGAQERLKEAVSKLAVRGK